MKRILFSLVVAVVIVGLFSVALGSSGSVGRETHEARLIQKDSDIGMWIWADKYVYRPGEQMTVRGTYHVNRDIQPYAMFAYIQNNQTGERTYFTKAGQTTKVPQNIFSQTPDDIDTGVGLTRLDAGVSKVENAVIVGFEVCRILRKDPETQQIPILILSARSTESDKVLGLELGANDYITKPFGVRELVARVRTTLRKNDTYEVESYNNGRLDVHFENYEVRFEGENRRLTLKECGFLKVLILNAGRALAREKILNSVWGYSYYGDARTVDVYIRRIRRKLGPSFKNYIETVTGVGYRFRRPYQDQASSTS